MKWRWLGQHPRHAHVATNILPSELQDPPRVKARAALNEKTNNETIVSHEHGPSYKKMTKNQRVLVVVVVFCFPNIYH